MRPIDADEVLKIVERYGTTSGTSLGRHAGIADIIYYQIEKLPTVEAEPVRRGHIIMKKRVIGGFKHYKCPGCSHVWQKDERHKTDELFCSECGKVLSDNYLNFCPNCGAKMDKDNNEK